MKRELDQHPMIPYGKGEKGPAVAEQVEFWILVGGFTESEARHWVAEHSRMTYTAVERAHQRHGDEARKRVRKRLGFPDK
jgi:hypothetical protein